MPKASVEGFLEPLPTEWIKSPFVAVAFLMGVAAGGTVGATIVPPAMAVLAAVSNPAVPPEVIQRIAQQLIAASRVSE